MAVSALRHEPLLPTRLRRPLAAVWISLALHAALIALVQVAPPPALRVGEPAIEVRLLQAPSADDALPAPAAETPAASADAQPMPQLAPLPAAEAEPVVPPAPPAALPAAESPAEPRADAPAGEPAVVPSAAPAPALAITSAVDLTYYSARELDVQPRALREIVPDYPADADRQRLSGKVRLELKLEADGRISGLEVVSASPPGVFDASTIDAFRDARFAPAQKNGRPVRARVVIEIVYDWTGRGLDQ